MNKEEIKHFKSLLRQGSLRHMNILLDDKFQKELLTIIKDYEKLQQENKQLQKDIKNIIKILEKNCDELEATEEEFDSLDRWQGLQTVELEQGSDSNVKD